MEAKKPIIQTQEVKPFNTQRVVKLFPHTDIYINELTELFQLKPETQDVILSDLERHAKEGLMSEPDIWGRFISLLRNSHKMVNMKIPTDTN